MTGRYIETGTRDDDAVLASMDIVSNRRNYLTQLRSCVLRVTIVIPHACIISIVHACIIAIALVIVREASVRRA